MVAKAFKQVNPVDPKLAETDYAKANPTKRPDKPEEVAKIAAFIVSSDASYMSGQTIAVNGGQSNSYGKCIS